MAIYGRTGQAVTILRVGTLEDVKKLDGRKPDKQDKHNVKYGGYVVALDDGKERLYHQAFLRADNGAVEIGRAIEATVPRVDANGVCDRCEAMPTGADGRSAFCIYHRTHPTVPTVAS